jgi:Leucine-rich repeat (LRR) protein
MYLLLTDTSFRSLQLDGLPAEISLLKSLTKHNRITDLPANDQGYSSIEAKLRLYLGNNALFRVPTAILELDNLRLLSLRQNNLSHIPAGVRKFVNLESLNISGNRLRYLPFEIIELFHRHSLVELVADPNPWEECMFGQEGGAVDEVSLTNQRKCLDDGRGYLKAHIGRSTLFRANGTPYVESKSSTSVDANKSRAPHLTELVLRRLAKVPKLSSIDSTVIEELPETMQRMLSEVQDAQMGGGRQCTKCHSAIVMPRKQWLEWWSIGSRPGASLVPFLRQQCNELCDGTLDQWTTAHALP